MKDERTRSVRIESIQKKKSITTNPPFGALEVLWSPSLFNIGLIFEINTSLLIGRSVLPITKDPDMSRIHCLLQRTKSDEMVLTDKNSTNGTLLDFKFIGNPVFLQHGQLLLCGSTIFVYHRGDIYQDALKASDLVIELPTRSSQIKKRLENYLDSAEKWPRTKEIIPAVLQAIESLGRSVEQCKKEALFWRCRINLGSFFFFYFVKEGYIPDDRYWNYLPGVSLHTARLRKNIATLALSNKTALIKGETGTGKELVARALHYTSKRSVGPYITFNCSMLDQNLGGAELFGHIKGAYTGAVRDQDGMIVQAAGGSLFLDEIGDIPSEVQAQLLRFLENKEVKPIGGRTKTVDVRVITATNIDLEQAMQEKRFREDLYYRIAQVEITTEPLRRLAPELWFLFVYFLAKESALPTNDLLYPASSSGQTFYECVFPSLKYLFTMSWSGNIREFKNIVGRIALLVEEKKPTTGHEFYELVHSQLINSSIISTVQHPAQIPSERQEIGEPANMTMLPMTFQEDLIVDKVRINNYDLYKVAKLEDITLEFVRKKCLHHFSKDDWTNMLTRYNLNISYLAEDLGIARQTIYNKLKKLAVDPDLLRK